MVWLTLASPSSPQGGAHQAQQGQQAEHQGRGLGDGFDLNGESVGTTQVCVAETVECGTDGRRLIDVIRVRVVGSPEGGVGQDTVLDTIRIGVLHPCGDRRWNEQREDVVRTTEGDARVHSRFRIDGRAKGKHGVVGGPVNRGQERKHGLRGAVRGIRGRVIAPGRGNIDSRLKHHRIGDVDVLPHLVGVAVRLRILLAVRKCRPKADGFRTCHGIEGEHQAGGENCCEANRLSSTHETNFSETEC